jgi:tetratricopeptide (TPR) repeat protein
MKAGVEQLGGQAGEQRRWGRAVRGGGLVGVSLCGMLLLGGCASLTGAGGTTLREDAPKVSTSKIHLTERNRAIYDVLAGELAGQAGDPKQALAYYLKALHEAPEPELARRVIDIATYLGENDTALEAARRWVELEANSVDAQRAAGVIEARAGHPLRATAHLRRFVVLSGKPYGNSLVLCGALLSQGVDREVALQTMRALASDFPREAYAHYALGTLALHLDDNAQALDSADRALKLKPNFKEALILKAQAQMGMNQPHRALRTLQDALGKDRGDVGLQLAYARLLVQLKRYDAARDQFRALLKHHPDNANVLYTLGLLDYQLGRDAEARSYLQRLLRTGEHSAAAEYFLGRIAERGGDMSTAMRHYANVDSGPYQFDARVRVAYILAGQGDLDQARQYLQQLRASIRDRSHKVDLYMVEAELLEKADDGAGAMGVYNEALNRYPGNQRLLYARALLADKLGNLGQTEADLGYIVQHHPDNAMALNALGYTLADQTTRYREALGYIQRALALRPDDPAILDSMGWVQYRLKHYEAALRYLRRAYETFKDPEVAAHLVEVLFASDKRAEALKTLDAALKAHPGDTKLEQLKKRFVP